MKALITFVACVLHAFVVLRVLPINDDRWVTCSMTALFGLLKWALSKLRSEEYLRQFY